MILTLPMLLGTDVALGHARMERREYRLAAAAFRRALDASPESEAAAAGLGRALAGQERCAEAMGYLGAARGSSAWSTEVALAEAGCRSRSGDLPGAEAALREALLLQPDFAVAWYELAFTRLRGRDLLGFEEALDGLDQAERGEVMALIARAWFALETGAEDVDLALAELRSRIEGSGNTEAEIQGLVVDGVAWLDAGDPQAAALEFGAAVGLSLQHVRAGVWLAEATRRMGTPDEALNGLARPRLSDADIPLLRAVRARALVDVGNLEGARVALGPDEGQDPELLASAWYLARAEGDPRAAELARAWAAAGPPRSRTLAQLVPVTVAAE